MQLIPEKKREKSKEIWGRIAHVRIATQLAMLREITLPATTKAQPDQAGVSHIDTEEHWGIDTEKHGDSITEKYQGFVEEDEREPLIGKSEPDAYQIDMNPAESNSKHLNTSDGSITHEFSIREFPSFVSSGRSLSKGKETLFCEPRAITEAASFGLHNDYFDKSVLLKNTKSLEAAEEAAKTAISLEHDKQHSREIKEQKELKDLEELY